MPVEPPSDTVPLNPPSCSPLMPAHNVIIFGESGVGKSSVVNMLLGERKAPTSTNARGCTFASVHYDVDLGDGVSVRVHDTAGLDESSAGTVRPENAVAELFKLLRQMEDGISLLVFVTRLGRITKRNQKNYRLFFEGICQGKVPIVLVVTHGEDACDDNDETEDIGEAMEKWWNDNSQHFGHNDMFFDNQAVIVAKKKGYKQEYEKSRQKLRDLVRDTYLQNPWRIEGLEWFVLSIRYFYSLFERVVKSHLQKVIQELSSGQMTEHDTLTETDSESAVYASNGTSDPATAESHSSSVNPDEAPAS